MDACLPTQDIFFCGVYPTPHPPQTGLRKHRERTGHLPHILIYNSALFLRLFSPIKGNDRLLNTLEVCMERLGPTFTSSSRLRE